VRFRSRGGPDAPWNELALCAQHHLHGIHLGYLTVEGRAGEKLVWRFGTGEVWETHGDDDVRRAGASPAAGTDGGRFVGEGEGDAGSVVTCDHPGTRSLQPAEAAA
jgi:hypothetical protein